MSHEAPHWLSDSEHSLLGLQQLQFESLDWTNRYESLLKQNLHSQSQLPFQVSPKPEHDRRINPKPRLVDVLRLPLSEWFDSRLLSH